MPDAEILLAISEECLGRFQADARPALRRLAATDSNRLMYEAELFGEVSLGDLPQLIRGVVLALGAGEATRQLWDRYPLACAFFLMDAVSRDLDSGAVWKKVLGEIAIPRSYSSKWGRHFRQCLESLGLNPVPGNAEVGHFYVDSILIHGGLPDDAWGNFFKVLILPAVRRGLLPIDAREVIETRLREYGNQIALWKTTERFLDLGGPLAVRLVERSIAAATRALREGVVTPDLELPDAAYDGLASVVDAVRIPEPLLCFDPYSDHPVHVRFAEVSAERLPGEVDGECEYQVAGFADSGGVRDVVPAVSRLGRWHLDEQRLPVKPALGYTVSARISGLRGKGLESRTQLRALSAHGVWRFPRDRGKFRLSSRRERRLAETAAFVLPPGYSIETHGSARVTESIPLSGEWAGHSAEIVEASHGGTVTVRDEQGHAEMDLGVGRSLVIEVRDSPEGRAPVGEVLGDHLSVLYGSRLPVIEARMLDDEPVNIAGMSCEVFWGPEKMETNVFARFSTDRSGFRARLDLATVEGIPALAPRLGVRIRYSGEAGDEVFGRVFARAPIGLVECVGYISGDIGCQGVLRYQVPLIDIDSTTFTHYAKSGAISVSPNGGLWELDVPEDCAGLTMAAVANSGERLSFNLGLAGVRFAQVGLDGLLSGRAVPLAALSETSGRFELGLRPDSPYGLEICAAAPSVDEDPVDRIVIRGVGCDEGLGSRADVSIHEIVQTLSSLPSSSSMVARFSYPGGEHTRELLRTADGWGLGDIRIESGSEEGTHIVVTHEPALSLDLVVRDMTRPWRAPARATIAPGDRSFNLNPVDYALLGGQYGTWVALSDDWYADTALLDASDPAVIQRVELGGGVEPDRGSTGFVDSLTLLMLHAYGFRAINPRLGSQTRLPRRGMLGYDARAAAWAGLSSAQVSIDKASQLAWRLRQLESCGYALSAGTLRELSDPEFAELAGPSGLLQSQLMLGLPALAVVRDFCSTFDRDELDHAWHCSPLLGFLSGTMHVCAGGEVALANQCLRRGLVEVGLAGATSSDLWQAVGFSCDRAVAVTEPTRGIRLSAQAPPTFTDTLFEEWVRDTTQKDLIASGVWLGSRLPVFDGALDELRPDKGMIGRLASRLVHRRDCSERTKTYAGMPFASGLLALVTAGVAIGDAKAVAASRVLGGGRLEQGALGYLPDALNMSRMAHVLFEPDLLMMRMLLEIHELGERYDV